MFKEFHIHNGEANRTHYKNIKSILYEAVRKGEKRCKLYSCNAEIWEYNGIIALVSYSTPIAVYTPDDESLYDCLRIVFGYTATSSQHIRKFSKWLAENNYPVKEFVRFIY